MLTLAAVMIISGLLIAGLHIPFLTDRIAPNRFYGFRTPATLRSPELWYRANRKVARRMVITGLTTAVTAAGSCLVAGITEGMLAAVTIGVMMTGIVWALVAGFRSTWSEDNDSEDLRDTGRIG